MEFVWTFVVPLAVAYLVASLPLGAWLLRAVTGLDARDADPHLLGVENVYKLVGPWVALATFALDVVKGTVAVAVGTLAGATMVALVDGAALPWAMATAPSHAVGVSFFGALFGHLHPLPVRYLSDAPRGRGNGVAVGALATLHALGAAPFWVVAVGVGVYAAVLAASGYAAVASVAGYVALVGAAAAAAAFGVGPWAIAVAVAATTVVVAWRQKAAFARVRDGTEPRLGDPPAVRGIDPNTTLCAFLVHPMTYDDVWQPRSMRWMRYVMEHWVRPGRIPEAWLKRAFLNLRPQFHGVIEGIRLSDGRNLRVLLISAPLLPDQFRASPDEALRLAIQGARFAHRLGAEVVGLGAFWSTVGDKGRDVQQAVPEIVVTNGGAYTAATVRAAVPGLLRRFKAQGGDLRRATAAVVGANGVVAFGVARMIAPEVGELILVGRDRERLRRSAATLRRKFSGTLVRTTTDVDLVAEADLVFTATSDPRPVVFAHHVKPGAWVYDLGRPADVDEGVREVPGVELVPGGVVRPPGTMQSRIDLRFGSGHVPACLAETMILAATRAYDRRSLGSGTRSADIAFYLREGERLGFEIVTRDARVARTPVGA